MLSSLLISMLGRRLGVVVGRFLPYLLAVLAVVGILWGTFNYGYDGGVRDTEAKYQAAIVKERFRQIEANAEALTEARQRQEELERLLDERNTEIEEMLVEASEDPEADRRAIGTSSVLRLNRRR